MSGIEDIDVTVTANVEGNVTGEKTETKINNLKTFVDSANGIKVFEGETSSKIIANIEGNVFEKTEAKINNLKVFTDSAKDIKQLEGETSSKITANVEGNVVNEKTEAKINNLKTFVDSANGIKVIEGETSSKIIANVEGNVFEKTESKINNLKTFVDSANGFQNKNLTSTVTANVEGNVFTKTEAKINNLDVFVDSAKGFQNKDLTSTVTANAEGNAVEGDGAANRLSSLTEFKSLVSGMTNQTVAVSVTANVDSANINQAITLLTNVANSGVFKDYNATVKVGAAIAKIDDTVVQEYEAPSKEGKVSYSVDPESSVYTWTAPSKDGVVNYNAEVEALTESQKNKTGTITYKANIIGLGGAAGTAHASGSTGRAFARGDWGIKGNGVALGGELGQELVVRDGKFFTIGDAGAEFFRYKKNDIVFNAAQTESLFKYGGIKGANPRGKILASGTAFAEGNAFAGSSGTGGAGKVKGTPVGAKKKKNTDNKKASSKSNSSSTNSTKDEFEEVIDWIEIAIDRIERDIDRLEQKAGNIFESWSSRNNALTSEISKVGDEIALQQKAYNRYIKEANSVGLSSSYAKKVRNGTIDIQTIKDEALKEKIDDYRNWYEKALDCQKTIDELKETEASLYKQRFENVATRYDGILGVIEHEKNMLEEYISQSEAQAWLVSAKYYDALASNEKNNIAQLKKEKAEMLVELQTAMESKTIKKGSEAWYDLCGQIDEVTLAITEGETRLKEYAQTLQQLSWEHFDLLQDKISFITEETEFLIELLSNDKLYNDNGKLTDAGMATMGQHGVAYNTHMYQADQAAAEAEKLKKELAKDPYDTELEERYREMISLQQEHILAAEDEKEAIRDMVEEGINLELEALEERIDKYNEALDSQKDLYDYQKKVKEQTEEIASLEKQMAAYSGDNSEEAKAKIQELKVSLEDAKAELQETEYDKYISDTQQMLDDLSLQYSEILNTRLDNIDALIADMIVQINTDASSISTTLSEKADSVGYTLSDSMNTIWDTNSAKINGVITTYGEKFSTAQTTTNNALNTININLQNVISQLNKLAKTNVKSASASSAAKTNQSNTTKKNSNSSTTTNKTQTKTNTTKSISVGGKINAGSAQIYDYAGDKSGERQLYRKDPIYKVLKTDGNWLQVRWHKLSSGITGWFKKGDVKAYASGKKNFLDDEIAWTQDGGREFIVRPSDGAILTPVAKGDSVLSAVASNNIWSMANSPADFIRDNLNLGATVAPNNSNVQSNYTQHLDKVVFNFPNVKNYDEMLSAMQKDKNFERLVHSMTFDKMTGKNSLSKGKSIR